jgi:hypothetical protein
MCGEEKPERTATQGLAARLCSECIRLLQEKVLYRELEQRPKIVRV